MKIRVAVSLFVLVLSFGSWAGESSVQGVAINEGLAQMPIAAFHGDQLELLWDEDTLKPLLEASLREAGQTDPWVERVWLETHSNRHFLMFETQPQQSRSLIAGIEIVKAAGSTSVANGYIVTTWIKGCFGGDRCPQTGCYPIRNGEGGIADCGCIAPGECSYLEIPVFIPVITAI